MTRWQQAGVLAFLISLYGGSSFATSAANQAELQPHPAFREAVAQVAPLSFPAPVLVPSAQASFFDALLAMGAPPSSGGSYRTDDWRTPGVPMYALDVWVDGSPMASLTGYMGSLAYEAAVARSLEGDDCGPSASYCATSPFSVSGPPTSERFSGLSVRGNGATVTHIVCCNGEYWTIAWYDPSVGASYAMELSLRLAAQVGANGTEPENRAYAQRVADIAAGLVPLPAPR
jgi:hypothetical protein